MEANTGRMEILLADDEAPIREGLVVLLEGEKYVVRTASDGEAALSLFEARRPDLVLLDVMMPGMSGYALCSEIRARDGDVPILFLTAKGGETPARPDRAGTDGTVRWVAGPKVGFQLIVR